SEGLVPYVLASKFPNGAVAVATEGRVTPDNSWRHPEADITLKEAEIDRPIGIFGIYKSLRIRFSKPLPEKVKIYAQDLLAKSAMDITEKVSIGENEIMVSGSLIEDIGTSAGDPDDLSVPGMVIKVVPN
ncbi:MAG: hypothetical protein WBG48_18530, partial [Pricia sp.]